MAGILRVVRVVVGWLAGDLRGRLPVVDLGDGVIV